jgi:hypothetical protein
MLNIFCNFYYTVRPTSFDKKLLKRFKIRSRDNPGIFSTLLAIRNR